MELKGGYYTLVYDIGGKSWEEVKELLYKLLKIDEGYIKKYNVIKDKDYYKWLIDDFIRDDGEKIIRNMNAKGSRFNYIQFTIGVCGNAVILRINLSLTNNYGTYNYGCTATYEQYSEYLGFGVSTNETDCFRFSVLATDGSGYLDAFITGLETIYYG